MACSAPAQPFAQSQRLQGEDVPAPVLNRGAVVYANRCAPCHGTHGAGDGPAGRALKFPPTRFAEAAFRQTGPGNTLPSDDMLRATIVQGRIDRGMPAWASLPPEDLNAVVQFIKTLSPKWRDDPKP